MTFDRPFFLFIYDALNKVYIQLLPSYFVECMYQVVIFWARVVEPKAIELN